MRDFITGVMDMALWESGDYSKKTKESLEKELKELETKINAQVESEVLERLISCLASSIEWMNKELEMATSHLAAMTTIPSIHRDSVQYLLSKAFLESVVRTVQEQIKETSKRLEDGINIRVNGLMIKARTELDKEMQAWEEIERDATAEPPQESSSDKPSIVEDNITVTTKDNQK